ncbi:MFS transporter [Massilia pinisoli]|uniref:MFS transporter n=1 Tax=Massilia pinisoli TaxID=1772194 RepID=A0ABT1ZJA9_9BURK|nr:MFS transporter [Massilia pinisoli]MCS0579990.1 MFS transporter [Massilia pinisoli]
MTISPATLSPPARTTAPGALPGLALSVLLSSFGASSVNVALPTLQRAFSTSFAAVQWIVLAYLLAATAAAVGAGRLGDAIGRRRVLLAGIVLFTTASGACALAPSLPLLVAARALQGLGAAVMLALGMALAAGHTQGRTGRAMGLLGSMSAVGTALGPALGGLLLAGPGWRAVFAAMLPGAVLAFALVRRLPDDATVRSGGPFDVAGLLLLVGTLLAFALAATGAGAHWSYGVAALCTAAFVLVEARARAPLVPLALLRDRVTATGFATSALTMALMMTTMLVGPFYLGRALGLGAGGVGLALAAGPLVAALAGVPAGRLVDRHGARRTGMAGLAAMAVGAGVVALAPRAAGVAGWIVPLAVLTTGYALFQAANNTAVMEAAGIDRRGVAAGLLNLARQLGLIAGSALLGAVFAAGAPDPAHAAAAQVAAATHATFALAALLPLLGLGAASLVRAR